MLENGDSITIGKIINKEYTILKLRPLGVEISYKIYTDVGIKMIQD